MYDASRHQTGSFDMKMEINKKEQSIKTAPQSNRKS
jgi:hypothetical protein